MLKSIFYFGCSVFLTYSACQATYLSEEDLTPKARSFYLGQEISKPKDFYNEYSYKLWGFSDAEGSHRWTVDKKPGICVYKPLGYEIKRITFKNTQGLISANYSQQLSVILEADKVAEYVYDITSPSQTIEIQIPASLREAQGVIIQFEIPNTCQPCVMDSNNTDPRELGVAFNEMEIESVVYKKYETYATFSCTYTGDDFESIHH